MIRRAVILKEDRWIDRASYAVGRACDTSDKESPSCKLALADYKLWVDGDFGAAEQAYRALQGPLLYGILMLHSGLPEDAAMLFERASETNPLSPLPHDWLSVAKGIAGDPVGSLEASKEFGRLISEDSVVPDLYRGVILAKSGAVDEAQQIANKFEVAAADARTGSDYESFARFVSTLIRAKTSTISEEFQQAEQLAEELALAGGKDFAAAVYLELGNERAEALFIEAATEPHLHRRGLALLMIYLDRSFYENPSVARYLETLGQTPEWKRELCRNAIQFDTYLDFPCEDRLLLQ